MRLLPLILAFCFSATAAHAACPSNPRVGQVVSVSGTVKSADVLMIFVRECGVAISVEVDAWAKSCRPGRQLVATGIYHETPLPFSPIPNIAEIRKLSCGGDVLR